MGFIGQKHWRTSIPVLSAFIILYSVNYCISAVNSLLRLQERQMVYIAGMTISVRIVDVNIPPTIGAAMRFITSAPAPALHMMGIRAAVVVVAVIIIGLIR